MIFITYSDESSERVLTHILLLELEVYCTTVFYY